ncbi:MAG: BrnT family toxin [Chloroflexi bacterium]|nr:MAG: BrnT family toxin [Chloroflexota bacterium]
MLYIEELIWDERNIEHIAMHTISRDEVEEVCYSEPLVRRARNELLAVYGQTESGRYLMVFLARRGRGIYYPVTARNMVDSERKAYHRAKGR